MRIHGLLSIFLVGCASTAPSEPHPSFDRGNSVSPPERIAMTDIELTLPRNRVKVFYGAMEGTDPATCDCWKRFNAHPSHEPTSPCVIRCHEVFERIEAYREIRKNALDEGDVEYWVEISRANDIFNAALKKTMKALETYDVAIRHGHVRLRADSKAKGIPDITEEVIKRLQP